MTSDPREGSVPAHPDKREDQPPAPPHVVMIVANDVSVDTRVRKMAFDVAEAGPRVTVLGTSKSDHREVTMLGKATVVRLPVPGLGSISSTRSGQYWLINRIRVERETFFLHQREVGAQIGWRRREYFIGRAERYEQVNRKEANRLARLKRRKDSLLSVVEKAKAWNSRFPRALVVRGVRLVVKADRRAGILIRGLRNRRRRIGEGLREKALHRKEERTRRRLKARHRRMENKVEKLRAELTRRRAKRVSIFNRRTDWRDELPELHTYDTTFGPELDKIAPDVIHAHDVHLLGVAARSVGRAIVAGRTPTLVYDAHEYVQGLSRYNKRILAAWSSLEREYVHHADRIITVSPPLAELLRHDYQLSETPTVVMNIPVDGQGGVETIRRAAEVGDDVPLVVYSGGLDATRGVHTLVTAVGMLPDVHLAIVSKAETDYVRSLLEIAEEGGFAHRVHMVPFVQSQDVVSYLRSATVAVHPMISGPMNHEIALPNKIFEYMYARLPMVVSNCKAMSDLVTELRIGEVFQSEDPSSLAASLGHVLDNIDDYKRVYELQPELLERFSWASQRVKLLELYQDILGPHSVTTGVHSADVAADLATSSSMRWLGIGPYNMAGQAWEWAKAVERFRPEIKTEVFAIDRGQRFSFPADVRIPVSSWRSLDWQVQWVRHVASSYTHVVLESGSGVLGTLNGGRLLDDLGFLRDKGIAVAVVLHGSDARNPTRHRQLVSHSPFEPGDELTERLERSSASTLEALAAFDGPVFVSTLDLLDHVPEAQWLPQVLTIERWQPQPFDPSDPLKVLFVPTNSRLKGGDYVQQICGRLEQERIIDLRIETDVPTSDMPELIASADVLIDGLVLGLYGTTAVEGMASGRVVLANLSRVLDRQPERPPIVHATPDTLEQILREVAGSPRDYKELAEQGPEYVRRFHDGTYAAESLNKFLNG